MDLNVFWICLDSELTKETDFLKDIMNSCERYTNINLLKPFLHSFIMRVLQCSFISDPYCDILGYSYWSVYN